MIKLPKLQDRRQRTALTQQELAERAKLTPTAISRIETGGDARLSSARRLARARKIKPSDLMAEQED